MTKIKIYLCIVSKVEMSASALSVAKVVLPERFLSENALCRDGRTSPVCDTLHCAYRKETM